MLKQLEATTRTIENLQRWLADVQSDIAYHKEQRDYYQKKGGDSDFAPSHIRNGFIRQQQWLAESEADCAVLEAEIAWLEFMACN